VRVDLQRRLFGTGALVIAVLAVVWVLFTGGSTYVVNARFLDAGQLVSGDLVTIAGHPVGSVGSITLTNNGLANVQLKITDLSIAPLQSTTLATIGQLSLTGVANRFVSLAPGVGGHAIRAGGTLAPTQTRGIVDLDIVLDALTPKVRNSLAKILKTGAYFIHSPTGADLNQFALYLNPALSQLTNLGAEIVSDKYALDRLVASTSDVAGALAHNSTQLAGAVSSTAAVLRDVAGERASLQGVLTRAPGVLDQSDSVLAHVDRTLAKLNPALFALQPVAPRLAKLIRLAVPFTQSLAPTVAGIKALLPPAKRAFQGFPAIAKAADPAILELAVAFKGLQPILTGIRPYVPDFIAGFFSGVGGATGAMYDANGHFLHTRVVGSGTEGAFTGLLSILGKSLGQIPELGGGTFKATAPCPGGATSSHDGSAPWTDPKVDPSVGTLCDPADDQ
jgi:phospholipid/cholesterol/gamma-HCH transport system substrate-binding protein